jgi:hypothetical protein
MSPFDPENFKDRDEPVNIEGLTPEDALRALLAVDPSASPVDDVTE